MSVATRESSTKKWAQKVFSYLQDTLYCVKITNELTHTTKTYTSELNAHFYANGDVSLIKRKRATLRESSPSSLLDESSSADTTDSTTSEGVVSIEEEIISTLNVLCDEFRDTLSTDGSWQSEFTVDKVHYEVSDGTWFRFLSAFAISHSHKAFSFQCEDCSLNVTSDLSEADAAITRGLYAIHFWRGAHSSDKWTTEDSVLIALKDVVLAEHSTAAVAPLLKRFRESQGFVPRLSDLHWTAVFLEPAFLPLASLTHFRKCLDLFSTETHKESTDKSGNDGAFYLMCFLRTANPSQLDDFASFVKR